MEREANTWSAPRPVPRRLSAPRVDRQELAAIFAGGFVGTLATGGARAEPRHERR